MKPTLLALLAVGCGGSFEDKVATPEHRIVIRATMPATTGSSAANANANANATTTTTTAMGSTTSAIEATRVRFLVTTTLAKEPRAGAAKVGVIKSGTVTTQARGAIADGCKDDRWIEIAPRGWTCATAITETTEPLTVAAPITFDTTDDDKPLVPGVYGVVRGAEVSTSVRVVGGTTIDGVRHVYTSSGATVPASSVAYFSPSKFRGVTVGKTLPAWIRNASDSRKPVITTDENGKRNGELAPRTIVVVLEESDDGKRVRVTDTAWVARRDLRVASMTEPPPGTKPNEKWFDVDRDEQVLVAYEGKKPVYATMVSTGKWKHATPTVIARVGSKLLTASMNNNRGDEQYAVADVPWTMYYDNSYALHTSYWHDGFGGPRSHGCINLSPRDARALYQWSSPDIPAGWIAVYGDEDNPGSVVRVRARGAEPTFRGYAKTMRDRDLVAAE